MEHCLVFWCGRLGFYLAVFDFLLLEKEVQLIFYF